MCYICGGPPGPTSRVASSGGTTTTSPNDEAPCVVYDCRCRSHIHTNLTSPYSCGSPAHTPPLPITHLHTSTMCPPYRMCLWCTHIRPIAYIQDMPSPCTSRCEMRRRRSLLVQRRRTRVRRHPVADLRCVPLVSITHALHMGYTYMYIYIYVCTYIYI